MRMQAYELSLIPPDLRREEAMMQIADSLDYVRKITDNIFKGILDRVGDYGKRLQSVCDRADVAQKKIDKIRGSSKATKVFSSCKYPGDETLDDYKVLFLDGAKPASSYRVKSKHVTPDEKVLKQKLQFYNVRVREKERTHLLEEGLGSLPKQLDSLSTLLLFNTSENPYKKYVILDPLGAVTKTKKSLEEETTEEIGAAPISISQRETMGTVEKINYFYTPGLGEVPEMDVPDALPDLPGIADDLLYSADLGPSIAPSSIAVSTLPDLPTIVPDVPDVPPDVTTSSIVPSDVLPPPPPPSIAPPPPPPPPPPPVTPASPPPEPLSMDDAPAVVPPSGGDARANLLESIRAAGGKAKLKSVQDRKMEAKKKKEEEKTVPSGGGDLMSDLLNKLQVRRKGISGANRAAESNPPQSSFDPSATLMKISSMIPPPPLPKQSDEDKNDDDDDWD